MAYINDICPRTRVTKELENKVQSRQTGKRKKKFRKLYCFNILTRNYNIAKIPVQKAQQTKN
jgi:hypothetical protein